MSDSSDDDIVSPGMKRKRVNIFPSSSEENDESIESDSETDQYDSDDIYSEDNKNNKENQYTNVKWKSTSGNRKPFDFIANNGQQEIVPGRFRSKCSSYVEKYLDDHLISIIVKETNLYADQFLQSHPNLKPRSRMRKWYSTTNNEVRCFIAILILQGIVKKPALDMYFLKREIICSPFFGKIFSADRFLLLCKFLYFENNAPHNDMPSKKLCKIKTVLEYVINKCKSLYTPKMDICIDESLLMWKGRLSWRQYIPSKRSRFGIQFFVLCESESGYIWNFFIYTGKETYCDSQYSEFNISARIVLQLCDELFERGYRLYLDNWYTGVPFIEKLCAHKTDVVGTIRKNRIGICEEVRETRIKKGEYIARFKNKIMLLKWRDKREVYLVSTVHNDNIVEMQKRNVIKKVPEVVFDYNNKMGGVDMSDSIIIAYSTARKRLKKYYKKIFLHLLDVICLNSYLIYKMNGGKLSRIHFLLEYIEDTIASYPIESRNLPKSRSTAPNVSRLIEKHFPDYIPGSSRTTNPSRRCAVCYKKKIRKESRYWCPTCQVPLCVVPCFREYHTTETI
ncbi:piggyBac transposable element-derived protein 4 [Orussus abietinus]|uniref:piggyBac transposable element-derived protein 4 n=1 Tax=Orussus abietinus TaxID=222816 RepID=UPI0006252F91|nr:piggyBac transposable element-derived protein 4 [Orussus abietinus]